MSIIHLTDKFHALTNRVLDNVLNGNQYATFPYDPNAKEVTIIKHFRTPAFILGRSGTGKTTCLLYKLLSRYLASRSEVTEDKEHCQVSIIAWAGIGMAALLMVNLYHRFW